MVSDLGAAQSRFELALEFNPRFTEAWVNLGWVELQRGNFDLASHHFERAKSLNADLPTPHHALGVLAERVGKEDAAEGHYRDALLVAPDFAEARVNLGRLLYARGAFDAARAEFAKLTEVAPQNPAGHLGWAEALLKLKRLTEAEEAVFRYRRRFGDTPEARIVVARLLLERGDHAGAEEVLEPVTQHRDLGVVARAWAWISVARLEAGEEARANQAADEALRFDPNDAVAKSAKDAVRARVISGGGRPQHRPIRR